MKTQPKTINDLSPFQREMVQRIHNDTQSSTTFTPLKFLENGMVRIGGHIITVQELSRLMQDNEAWNDLHKQIMSGVCSCKVCMAD